jgi:hypothetical protein
MKGRSIFLSILITKMTQPEAIPAPTGFHRLKRYYDQNERQVDIAFFVGGFVFDIVTLSSVDSWFSIGQQIFYLAVIATGLLQMFFEEGRPARQLETMPAVKRWYYEYRTAIIHFLLGSLLSVYTLFFFKSSSLLVSFSFLAFLVLVLVANESRRFKATGLSFKFALLSLCVLCFSAILVPVVFGSIGLFVFLLSMLIGSVPMVVIHRRIRIHAPERVEQARKQILVPFSLVLIGFLMLYLFRLIPPVPLSIPFIGVYHGVEKTAEVYRLSHQRPSWRFWHHGDQHFVAQPGDKVYVFFRIFSPARFSDQVTMRWYWKDKGSGWKLHDSIPINIVGGREQGFRGYGLKSNYQPGDWKVQVETNDGREIGRVYFDVESATEAPRTFEIDLQ